MRIVAGKFRGRKLLDSTNLKSLRPTTDANRESLFNILFSAKFIKEIEFLLNDAIVIDVCCGSGAVAFEALSRGVKKAILIDNSKSHLELAKKNAALLQVENQCEFLLCDAKNISFNTKKNQERSLLFIDPPYEEDYQAIINNLVEKNWSKKNDLLVIEKGKGEVMKFDESLFRLLEVKQYGISVFYFLLGL